MAMACTVTLAASIFIFTKGKCLVFSKFCPQVFILSLTLTQLLCLWVHYFFTRHVVVLAYAQRCIYVLEFSSIFFFFSVLVCRVMRRRLLIRRLIAPVAGATVVAVLLLFVVGTAKGSDLTCGNDLWKILTLFCLIISISLIGVGAFVTSGITHTDWMEFRMKKSRRLWFLILVNCLSTLAAFVWDLGLLVKDPKFGCNFIMGDSIIENVLWVIDRLVANLLPIWSVLYIITTLPIARNAWRYSTGINRQTLLVEGSNAANDSDSEVDLLQNWKREELWRDLNLAASSVGAGISSTAITDTRQGFGSVQQTPSYSPSFSPPSS